MSSEKLPIDSQLVENLRVAKSKLAVAQQIVTDAESAIYLAVQDKLPEKGTTNFEGLKIVTKLSEKWSQEKLTEIERTWPRHSNLPFPFQKEWSPDGKAINYLRDNAKDAYERIEVALTTKPAKPAFNLTDKE